MGGPVYEIRVAGIIPEAVLVGIHNTSASIEPAHTVLRGPLPDQAALHGVITRLQSVGLEIIEVRRIPDIGDPLAVTVTPQASE